VQSAQAVAEDPVLRRRGHMVLIDHAEAGPMWQSALPAILSRTPGPAPRAAPLQGQHSHEVFRELLGMSDAEYAALVDAEITGTGPTRDASVDRQA
jgi:crotonobetainyl-CoA:carnitine CoA-transferase CaiB-like acyl-CoA transferase